MATIEKERERGGMEGKRKNTEALMELASYLNI